MPNNLSNLTERDLLLLTAEKVSNMEESYKDTVTKVSGLEFRVHELELKIKIWAAVIGGAAGFIFNLISQQLFNHG